MVEYKSKNNYNFKKNLDCLSGYCNRLPPFTSFATPVRSFNPASNYRRGQTRGRPCLAGNRSAKNHACDICGRSFRDTWILKRHKLTHQKSHDCMICGLKFNSAADLIQHMVTHNSNLPVVQVKSNDGFNGLN